jgi:hypothetical protein
LNSDKDLRVRICRFSDLDEGIPSAWGELEDRALEPNVYLSPGFVIPSLRHLRNPEDLKKIIFVFIEKTRSGRRSLVGAGVFEKILGTRRFPLPHLKAYSTPYSFLTGLLVDRNEAEAVIRAFFRFFGGWKILWQGVEFVNRPMDGPQAVLIEAVSKEFGAKWFERVNNHRSVLIPADGGEEYLLANFTPHRLKEMRRMKRRLEEKGKVQWAALVGDMITEKNVENLIELEHMGWKGEEGTSLRSRPAHEMFFRELVDSFIKNRKAFITELSLDGTVIASTVNLISGGAGFAFKIGWHPEYTKVAPGILNELEFVRKVPEVCGDLTFIDSGAEEGSFIDGMWAGRRTLSGGFLGTTLMGKAVLANIDRIRKNRIR